MVESDLNMRDAIAKSDWLTFGDCPTEAWYYLRACPEAPSESEFFRLQQGQEIGALARQMYPEGTLISPTEGEDPAGLTSAMLGCLLPTAILQSQNSHAWPEER